MILGLVVLLLDSIWFFSVANLLAIDLALRLLDLEGNEFTSSEIIFVLCVLCARKCYQVDGLEPTEGPIQQVFWGDQIEVLVVWA